MVESKCPNCGADIDVDVPEQIRHDAERWQHKLEVEARRKKEQRKKDPNYCRVKKSKQE
jgi:hypothetical protein